jgi:hypothetical protein
MKPSLAIAYNVKRKPKKKASGGTVESGSKDMNYAEGGSVNAKNAKRPMPDNTYDDTKMANQNRGNKPAKDDSWTSNITVTQAQKPSITKLSQPKMAKITGPFNVRSRDMHDDEASMMDRLPPQTDTAQPPSRDDEEGPKRMGADSDMADEHSTKRKPYNKAIEDQYAQDVAAAEMKKTQSYAKGGEVEASDYDHPLDGKYEDDVLDLPPSEDEGASSAHSKNELNADGSNPNSLDMEDEHSTRRKPYAGGGEISDSEANIDDDMVLNPAHGKYSADDSEDQPQPEEHEEHSNSITAAIMAKRDRLHAEIDSGAHDMDEAVRMAEGGQIHSKGSWDTHESADQADLSRNADEDANEEDQMSFGALRKENYSESAGLSQLDNPKDSAQKGDEEEKDSSDRNDMIGSIRKRMNMKRQFSK